MDPKAYRLEPVRGVRDRVERTARGGLAGAVGDARVTEAAVTVAAQRTHEARDRVDAAHTALATVLRATPRPAALANADRYLARCRAELGLARTDELRAREVHAGRLETVDTRRAELTAARADKEVIERHFARWREHQRKTADRNLD